MNCLETLIGISRTPCDCLVNNKAIDISRSESGYYIDETIGLSMCFSAKCGEGDIYERIYNARRTAITLLKTDISATLADKYVSLVGSQADKTIGESSFYQTINNPLPLQSLKIRTAYNSSNIALTIKRIALLTNQSHIRDVEITKNGETFKTIADVKNTASYSVYQNIEPIRLPLDGSEYEFSYSLFNNEKPMDNKFSCNCGGVISEMSRYINDFLSNRKANGISMQVTISCDMSNIVCDIVESESYKNVIADMLQHKSAEILLNDLLSSNQFDRYKLVNGEFVNNKINEYRNTYNGILASLRDFPNLINTNGKCYGCKSIMGVGRLFR